MILFPDMTYYNIHTHRRCNDPEVVAILDTTVERPIEEPAANDSASFSSASSIGWRSYGIHPWYISDVPAQMAVLRKRAVLPDTAAIGEAGLDKMTQADLSLQEEVFVRQILLAEELEKPLIIHCVKAWPELVGIKKKINPRMPWIIHSFRGKVELARQLLRQGCYLSFRRYFHAEAVRAAWPDRLFMETDEGESDIRFVYERVASALGVTLAECGLQTSRNVQRVFPPLFR